MLAEPALVRWLGERRSGRQVMLVECPHCKSRKIHLSRSGNDRLSPLAGTLLVVLRCYTCWRSFTRLRLTLLVWPVKPARAAEPERRAA